MAITPKEIVSVLVLNIVSITLIPVISALLVTANFTGTLKALTDLAPVFMAIMVLFGSVGYLYTQR